MAAAAGGGPVGPLDRGVQHVGDKPYTSIDAASDVDVIGRDAAVDPYIGTALGTVREAYCAANSNLPSAEVADVLAWVESETRLRLSKDYMLTGSLAATTLAMLARMSGAKNVLEIGAYTGYSTIALASTGATVTTIDSFEDEAAAEDVFHAGIEKSGLPIKLLRMKALEALDMLVRTPPAAAFDFVFIDADKTEQIAYYELLMSHPSLFAPAATGRPCTIVVDNTLWYSRVLRSPGDPSDACTKAVKDFTAHVKKDSRSFVTMLPVRDGMTIIQKL
eukprot:Tamp_19401.p1 GENE.Tamp_19401~~Tamp_19401.p1  ORF type:complete len:309 (+),score=64.84 Tamp_19401:97-927(+)